MRVPAPAVSRRAAHERWLLDLTAVPTAAGCEHRVVRWITAWARQRRRRMSLAEDAHGNLLLHSTVAPAARTSPLLITAHLDHPAFVVRSVERSGLVELEFRGGVHDPYFEDARLELFDADDRRVTATVLELDASAVPFKRVLAKVSGRGASLAPGDVGRWRFPAARITGRGRARQIRTDACDDLAAVVAALAAFDVLAGRKGYGHVGLLFTLAEEVGFAGAIAAARSRRLPRAARLLCLENSRSFPDSPIGGGPILRVGDRMTVFSPALTNRLGDLFTAHAASVPSFRWQRKLMPGGACEATAFATYGYESTCLCLPLGNYHNMRDIDGVLAGDRPARVGQEHVSVADFHGLVDMLLVAAAGLDDAEVPPLRPRLERIYRERRSLLGSKS